MSSSSTMLYSQTQNIQMIRNWLFNCKRESTPIPSDRKILYTDVHGSLGKASSDTLKTRPFENHSRKSGFLPFEDNSRKFGSLPSLPKSSSMPSNFRTLKIASLYGPKKRQECFCRRRNYSSLDSKNICEPINGEKDSKTSTCSSELPEDISSSKCPFTLHSSHPKVPCNPSRSCISAPDNDDDVLNEEGKYSPRRALNEFRHLKEDVRAVRADPPAKIDKKESVVSSPQPVDMVEKIQIEINDDLRREKEWKKRREEFKLNHPSRLFPLINQKRTRNATSGGLSDKSMAGWKSNETSKPLFRSSVSLPVNNSIIYLSTPKPFHK